MINYETVVHSFIIFPEDSLPDSYPVFKVPTDLANCKIIYEKIEFDFDDYKKALDVYLKIYQVFHLKYNQNNIHVLSFLQKIFFKSDTGYTSVNLTKALKSF